MLFRSVTLSQNFTAIVVGYGTSQSVTWSVQEGVVGGSISSTGRYTAGATTGTYHIVATSTDDTSVTASIPVKVTGRIVILPTAVTLSVLDTKTFTANQIGVTGGLTWTVQEVAGGTITAGGVYTAPSTAGTYHVIVTSQTDTTLSATATVTVQSGSGSGTIN